MSSSWSMPTNVEQLPNPNSHVMQYSPYVSPSDIENLSYVPHRHSAAQEDKLRQQACGFIEAVGAKLGLYVALIPSMLWAETLHNTSETSPRKTIATAQNLYHRFNLFCIDVTLAALYVSTKMHDTLKKPREILMAAYAIRMPELAAKSKVAGELDVDPGKVEHDRQRLLTYERLIMEMICFNFTSRMPFPYVIKFGRALDAPKKLAKLAWRLAIDRWHPFYTLVSSQLTVASHSHRTLVNIEFPPHLVALSCLYLASHLLTFHIPAPAIWPPDREHDRICEIAVMLNNKGDWEQRYHADVSDLEDLLISASQNPLTSTSPSTPASPHPTRISHPPSQQHAQTHSHPPSPFKADRLLELKVAIRECEHVPRKRLAYSTSGSAAHKEYGKNEGTVRYQFLPDMLVDGVAKEPEPEPEPEVVVEMGAPGSQSLDVMPSGNVIPEQAEFTMEYESARWNENANRRQHEGRSQGRNQNQNQNYGHNGRRERWRERGRDNGWPRRKRAWDS
ncbi:hypothetical protein NLI96_g4888 [Meripilus lineatus]|uniref:Cyclin-like protein n=1 Tax=Meripilus lineatus TaxID=2056292 RepID=A0AAD5V425_9APHY|nr:hypothetical protein NLI96_g4888 [Physisporinus lineatus]